MTQCTSRRELPWVILWPSHPSNACNRTIYICTQRTVRITTYNVCKISRHAVYRPIISTPAVYAVYIRAGFLMRVYESYILLLYSCCNVQYKHYLCLACQLTETAAYLAMSSELYSVHLLFILCTLQQVFNESICILLLYSCCNVQYSTRCTDSWPSCQLSETVGYSNIPGNVFRIVLCGHTQSGVEWLVPLSPYRTKISEWALDSKH